MAAEAASVPTAPAACAQRACQRRFLVQELRVEVVRESFCSPGQVLPVGWNENRPGNGHELGGCEKGTQGLKFGKSLLGGVLVVCGHVGLRLGKAGRIGGFVSLVRLVTGAGDVGASRGSRR